MSLSTRCNRTRSFTKDDEASEQKVIKELKHWLQMSKECDCREQRRALKINSDELDESLIAEPPLFILRAAQ